MTLAREPLIFPIAAAYDRSGILTARPAMANPAPSKFATESAPRSDATILKPVLDVQRIRVAGVLARSEARLVQVSRSDLAEILNWFDATDAQREEATSGTRIEQSDRSALADIGFSEGLAAAAAVLRDRANVFRSSMLAALLGADLSSLLGKVFEEAAVEVTRAERP